MDDKTNNNYDNINNFDELKANLANNFDLYLKENNKNILEKSKKSFKLEKDIATLEQLINSLKKESKETGKSFNELEDDYYNSFNCYSEKEKIILEIRLILTLIYENVNIYKENTNFNVNYSYLMYIIKRIESIPKIEPKIADIIKQTLILIELDFGIPISLYSQVQNIYESKQLDKNNLNNNGLGLRR